MNGITPEAREAAAQFIFVGMVTTGPRLPQHDLYWACALDTVDALVAAGWGPVSAPVVDREALAKALARAASDWTHDDCGQDGHYLDHSNWTAWLNDANALIAAGCGPVSAPVRPTIEALTAEMKAAEEAETTFNHTWTYHRKIAERLLAADHLWTEPAGIQKVIEHLAELEELLWGKRDDPYFLGKHDGVNHALDRLRHMPSGSVPTEEGDKK